MIASTYRWHILQLLSFVAMMVLFLAIVPYLGSDPIAEVPPDIASTMPVGCPSVFGNHAQYSCFWDGPLRDHKPRFFLLLALLLLFWGFIIYTAFARRGFPILKWARRRSLSAATSEESRPNKSLERTREG